MSGQVLAEIAQRRISKREHPGQHLVFRIGLLDRQSIVAEQAAEQAPVKQAKGFAGMACPELFGAAGHIGRQALAIDLQAEQLLWRGADASL
ncbi:hypothetical protein D3C75_1215140 [compost metagenome]